jgi:probable rRNA maturation factor|tara:strand:+ start:300 stop:839 length:540 start_codon:yes stop_codon:yes gene_type:complete
VSGTIDIAINIAARGWGDAVPDAEAVVRRAATAALGAGGGGSEAAAELSILLTDDAELRRLNATWRGRDEPTNVLSFAADDASADVPPHGGPRLLGDVALALETVTAEAARDGKAPVDHLAHLVIHGILHLLGHDHQDAGAAAAMEALEVEILAGLGIADPYLVKGRPPESPVRDEAAE